MATPPGKTPIVESARAGLRFTAAHWRQAAPAAVLVALLATLMQVVGEQPAHAAIIDLLLSLVWVGLVVAYTSFLLRLALRQDGSGFFGLKLGREEANLLGASLIVLFASAVFATIGFVIFAIAVAFAARGAGVDLAGLDQNPATAEAALVAIFAGPAGPLMGALTVVLLLALMWWAARIALVSAATIGEGRIMALSTWSWTRGDGLRIMAALLVLLLPLALAMGAVLAFANWVFMTVFGGADAAAEGGALAPHALYLFAAGLGQSLAISPSIAGLTAYLYKGLRPPDLPARS